MSKTTRFNFKTGRIEPIYFYGKLVHRFGNERKPVWVLNSAGKFAPVKVQLELRIWTLRDALQILEALREKCHE